MFNATPAIGYPSTGATETCRLLPLTESEPFAEMELTKLPELILTVRSTVVTAKADDEVASTIAPPSKRTLSN
jgi:hypothetical protein